MGIVAVCIAVAAVCITVAAVYRVPRIAGLRLLDRDDTPRVCRCAHVPPLQQGLMVPNAPGTPHARAFLFAIRIVAQARLILYIFVILLGVCLLATRDFRIPYRCTRVRRLCAGPSRSRGTAERAVSGLSRTG